MKTQEKLWCALIRLAARPQNTSTDPLTVDPRQQTLRCGIKHASYCIRGVARASLPFSPSLCAFLFFLGGDSTTATVDVCVCGVVLRGVELPPNFLSHGSSGGSRSLPHHHRAAKRLISAGLWDAEPGMEPEPGLVKPRSGGSWSAGAVSAVMKNHQRKGASSNYPHRACADISICLILT